LKDGISEAGNLRAGVPQGSVLVPLLFLVYVNDIVDEVLGLYRLFADDTSIGHSAHDEHTLVNLTDIDLSNPSKWSEQWLVKPFNNFIYMNSPLEIRTKIYAQVSM
jgi:hypothetical protein